MQTKRQAKINAQRQEELNWWRAKKAVISGLAEWLKPDDPLQPSYAMPSWIAADLLGVSRARVKQLLDAGILERGDCDSARRVEHGLGHQAGVTEVSVWRRMGIPFQAPSNTALVRQSRRRFRRIMEMRDERERLRHEQKRRAAGIPPRGAQEELEKATGYRDEFGRLTDPE